MYVKDEYIHKKPWQQGTNKSRNQITCVTLLDGRGNYVDDPSHPAREHRIFGYYFYMHHVDMVCESFVILYIYETVPVQNLMECEP
jgi:hypothetical protein